MRSGSLGRAFPNRKDGLASRIDWTRLQEICLTKGMSKAFDPAAVAEAMAPLIGVELTTERRDAVLTHLAIAADLAARLATVSLDDAAEPAPVFTP